MLNQKMFNVKSENGRPAFGRCDNLTARAPGRGGRGWQAGARQEGAHGR